MKLEVKNQVLENLINNYFDNFPFKIAIVNQEQTVVAANRKFEESYGQWVNHKCFELCHNTKIPCIRCQVQKVFESGIEEIVNDTSIDVDGNISFDLVIFSPIYNKYGEVEFVQELTIPQKEINHWENDFNMLFENVPNFISITDRDYNILRANRRMVNTFGNVKGKKCYEVYKRRKQICSHCPANETFETKRVHSSSQIGITATGEKAYYMMTSVPIAFDADGNVVQVMEINSDITEINKLQEQLNFLHDFYGNLIENSSEAIIAIDKKGKLQIFNSAAMKIFNLDTKRKPGIAQARKMLPESFFMETEIEHAPEEYVKTTLINADGEEVPVQLKIFDIKTKNETMGRVAIITDLRPIIELEESKALAREIAYKEKFATISKDINQTLRNMKVFLGEFAEQFGGSTSVEFTKKWNSFYEQTSDYLQISNMFIKYAYGINFKPTLIDLNQFIEDQYDYYQKVFEFSGIKIELHLSHEKPVIKVDVDSLRDVINVIIMHFKTYIKDNCGKITFRTYYCNDKIKLDLEVQCKKNPPKDFQEGVSLGVIQIIAESNGFAFHIASLEEEKILKISLIFD